MQSNQQILPPELHKKIRALLLVSYRNTVYQADVFGLQEAHATGELERYFSDDLIDLTRRSARC